MVLSREHIGHSKHPLPMTRKMTPHMDITEISDQVHTEIRLTIFFGAKNGEVLCSQQKQDLELTVAQIMNSVLPNSDLH